MALFYDERLEKMCFLVKQNSLGETEYKPSKRTISVIIIIYFKSS